MGVARVMGIETEYGVSVPAAPGTNAMVASSQVVNGYVGAQPVRERRTRWDFEEENPLRDARGFDVGVGGSDHLPGEPDEELGLANAILSNGARLYVDHAHPEYSSPEVTSPRAAVAFDRAGEAIMAESVRRLSQVPPGVNLYKNNTDGKGQSYGTHENYLMARSTPFASIVRHLTPFFVVRQVMCGSGRVGIGVDSRTVGYQIAQRSDFFEVEVGLETTLKRPLINTRDEPHAVADRYRRLHVILGDANHCDVANLLKMGTTSVVLAMIEADAIRDDLSVRRPVTTLHEISHDTTLQTKVELVDGRRMTALELLREYHDRAAAFVAQQSGGEPDSDTVEVMHWWGTVLDKLARDPMEARREVDWVAKLAVLEGYRERDSLGWGDPRLKAVDLQWSDVRADRGLAHRLVATGRLEVLVDEADVRRAVAEPPTDTRAWFRGTCLRRFPDEVVAASWDSVIFDVAGQRTLQRVPMLEPLKGTEAGVGELVRNAPDAASLLRALAANAHPEH